MMRFTQDIEGYARAAVFGERKEPNDLTAVFGKRGNGANHGRTLEDHTPT